MNFLVLKLDEDAEIRGRLVGTGPMFEVGDFTIHLSEKQLREVVEAGIDLLSDLNAARLPLCDGSQMPERAA